MASKLSHRRKSITTPPYDREAVRKLVVAARIIDKFLDGWCPMQCSCAEHAKRPHEDLRAALAAFKDVP